MKDTRKNADSNEREKETIELEDTGEISGLGNLSSPYDVFERRFETSIKNLSRPRFLGSIHLRKDASHDINHVDRVMRGDKQGKLHDSLRSTAFNPITKLLILLMILFNVFWILLTIF